MTPDDLDRLRKLCKAAEYGSWGFVPTIPPATVLRLLDRIAELELAALRAELGELDEGETPAGMFTTPERP